MPLSVVQVSLALKVDDVRLRVAGEHDAAIFQVRRDALGLHSVRDVEEKSSRVERPELQRYVETATTAIEDSRPTKRQVTALWDTGGRRTNSRIGPTRDNPKSRHVIQI